MDSTFVLQKLDRMEKSLNDLQDTVAKAVSKELEEIRALRTQLGGEPGTEPAPVPTAKAVKEEKSSSDSDKSSSSSSSSSGSSSSSSSSSDSDSDSESSREKRKEKRKKAKGKKKAAKSKPKKKRGSDSDDNGAFPSPRGLDGGEGDDYDGEEPGEGEYVPPAGGYQRVLVGKGKGRKYRFKCRDCSATYSRKDALQRHELRHTGARPFQCPHCESAFRSSANLIVHVQRKHGVPRHLCNLCQKRFVAPSLLRAHLQKTHRGMVSNLKLCSVCQFSSYDLVEFNLHLNTHGAAEIQASQALAAAISGAEVEEVAQDPEVLESGPTMGQGTPGMAALMDAMQLQNDAANNNNA